jgi:hypothetical protein
MQAEQDLDSLYKPSLVKYQLYKGYPLALHLIESQEL